MAKTPLEIAQSQIGIKESPAGSNRVKYNTWYYGRTVSGAAYPWCAVFIDWCYTKAGQANNIRGVKNKAYCPSYVSWAKATKKWTQTPKPGHLVLFDWDGDGVADHIGIVERVLSSTSVQTIEGNTGNASQNNGGEVMRRVRYKKNILGYINTGASAKPVAIVSDTKLSVDGDFGKASVTKLQAWLGTTKDGVISGQAKSDKKYIPAISSVQFDKGTGSQVITALQKLLNKSGAKLKVDGLIGTKTNKAFQKYLNGKQKAYNLAIDGYFGKQTAKAAQTFLNTK